MKITKYNQACLLIETKGKRILIDPGSIGYTGDMLNKEWININTILITHKHKDHCHQEAVNTIIKRDNAKLYTSKEVVDKYHFNNVNIVKENDTFHIDDIRIEVTKAIHGYLTGMHENDKEILENIGFIIDDGEHRLYTTSDTINFYNQYQCDILCMPFNGNGLTMGIIDGIMFAKAINPKLLIPIHMQHPKPIMNPNLEVLKKNLVEANINYNILNIGEMIEI
jgi:L-ascorbate metabolism protein UlaG (beta-lactamase superfamily)